MFCTVRSLKKTISIRDDFEISGKENLKNFEEVVLILKVNTLAAHDAHVCVMSGLANRAHDAQCESNTLRFSMRVYNKGHSQQVVFKECNVFGTVSGTEK